MNKLSTIGRGAAFIAAAVIILLPALLTAQATANKPPEKPRVVDMGTYKVSAPPGGGWDVDVDKKEEMVSFMKSKGTGVLSQMFPAFASQARESTIVIYRELLQPDKWRTPEEQAAKDSIDAYAWESDVDRRGIEALVKREVLDLHGKRLYFAKWHGPRFIRPGKMDEYDLDYFLYLYFPSDFKFSHRFFHFESCLYRPKVSPETPGDPGLEPVLAVIDSLEIADPLRDISGPQGDLIRAAAAGQSEGVLQAIEKGVDINAAAPVRGALSVAAGLGRREIVDLLIERRAAIDAPDAEGGATPLVSAIMACEPEIAGLFVEKGADVNRRIDAWGRKGLSPLMLAAAIGLPDLARALIGAGAEVDARSGQGERALSLACEFGSAECVALLLEKGADVNAQSSNGWTALMRAADYSRTEIVEMLLANKADPNLKQTDDGWTALMMAVRDKQPGITRALIDHGADVNAQWAGEVVTAFNGAVVIDAIGMAAMLAEAGADVNTKMKDGRTPLIVVAENGSVDMVKLLIQKRANLNATNNKGQTALKFAKKKKNAEIVKLLQAAGAKG
jgi:ankyrin repeat protein